MPFIVIICDGDIALEYHACDVASSTENDYNNLCRIVTVAVAVVDGKHLLAHRNCFKLFYLCI